MAGICDSDLGCFICLLGESKKLQIQLQFLRAELKKRVTINKLNIGQSTFYNICQNSRNWTGLEQYKIAQLKT